ncbi:PREDICTED: bone sialoprotein 2 [Hipposideros armiger]|uniref:Integrin-binding sialoprotein n=1 Tax=Hipposideros armiger TaxID=186990 RepID=A0A8B7TD48_HIPAR|nr:PREDICTED: bone sialoprotein 2 [Hipposideros armiger]
MKTALILLSILGMACAFSMKNFHRRAKLEDSEENGVFKYRPRYYLYKHAYFYPPVKRFPVQSSDSSEENGDGDSSEEEEEEEEASNEEANNEESNENEDEESEAENSTLSATTPGYGGETTPDTGTVGLAAIQLPKAGDTGKMATKKEESDEEEEEEEEEENENEENEAEVDENGQGVNGTSTNSTDVENGNGSSGGDNGEEEGEEESVPDAEGTTVAGEQDNGRFEPTTLPQEVYETTPPPLGETTTSEYEGEYEQTGTNEYDNGYEVYENERGEPRGDNYRAYDDEYSYYKGHSYDSYDGQNYYYHQ